MLFYKYTGRTKEGALKRGTIEGRSRQDVIQKLRNEGNKQFHIYLTLEHKASKQTLSTESEIGIIDDGN